MDFLLSVSILRWEILFLAINIWYIFFHFFFEIFSLFSRIKSIIKPKRKNLNDEEIKAAILEQTEWTETTVPEAIKEEGLLETGTVATIENQSPEENIVPAEEVPAKEIELSKDQKDEISEITKIAKNKIWRWEYSDAKAKIIEWLSIEKFNKSLNLLLASLYEKDKDYKKAEFIYKDLIVLNDHDTEIYLKLWFILSIQSKYEVAFEIYKKLHSIDKNNVEAVEMLANLAHHLGNFEDSRHFSKLYLKKTPRSIDMLYLQALNLINLEERKDALETLLKIKQIEPYNVKVNELIEKLKLEIELENNFSRQ
ncbi:MAG: hypothetical protein ACD_2C00209G0010 [uncultured bacterium (gcode 4)]|uniref:Uncharacterized protein n=1 Tax=uncultured bacterium (gcode 4) TaxID=1234023 RepID=K2FDN1_9BACT|nr:MAG: hypothetical protein ACD_2C00209G0010 [uncultured bacterium (gcode 4)]